MDDFAYKSGVLYCEQVDLTAVARAVGTPAYVYSAATLKNHYAAMAKAFSPLAPTICYSIKALSNLSVLRLLASLGAGFDVVSGGEIFRAQKAGGDMSKVAYAGVGKTDAEIRQALAAGVGFFNVESEQEFENIARLARQEGKRARAALRINPDVDPKTHRYTTTGKKETKFGVDLERAERFFAAYGRDEYLHLCGVHVHLGSAGNTTEPYVQAITKAVALIDRLRAAGFAVEAINIGGGYGADYEEHQAPPAAEYAKAIVPLLKGKGLQFLMEPGRQIACNAGVLLTSVQYLKEGGTKKFVIVDATMADLIRPALYDAWHFIYPARLGAGEAPPRRSKEYSPPGAITADIVGGVCEGSDFLGKERRLPAVQRGDLLAVYSAGAYGFTMSSQYNARPRAAEVLVDGSSYRVVRRRETSEDLIAGEEG
jgi:diaminopimelate decarboxylase